jgi:hypothetical protein
MNTSGMKSAACKTPGATWRRWLVFATSLGAVMIVGCSPSDQAIRMTLEAFAREALAAFLL